jgi:hypothetical protein
MHQNMITKDKILTELFKSNQLQEKLPGIMARHHIPMKAGIQDDIIQTTFENLCMYDTDKMIEAYNHNPKRVLALGVTIMLRKCILKDKRYNNHKHSLTTFLLYASSFNTANETINHTDSYDEELFTLPAKQDVEDIEDGVDYLEMWEYIKLNLTKPEIKILNKIIQKEKVDKTIKKELLNKIKTILL